MSKEDEIVTVLKDLCALPSRLKELDAFALLEYLESLPQSSELASNLRDCLPELGPALQQISRRVGVNVTLPPMEEHDAEPLAIPGHPILEAEKQEGEDCDDAEQSEGRRRPSKPYDFLLLEGVNQQPAFGNKVGQDSLLKLGQAYDRQTKKGSLVAKLNRWRNTKKWVDWTYPEDISLLEAGEQARVRLMDIANHDGEMENIQSAFKTAWGIEVNPS